MIIFWRLCRVDGPFRHDSNIVVPGSPLNTENVSKPKRSYQKFLSDLDKIAPEVVYQQEEISVAIDRMTIKEQQETSDCSDIVHSNYDVSHTVHLCNKQAKVLRHMSSQQEDGDKIGTCIREQYSEECSICLETFSWNERLRVLPCKHSFHSCCIMQWLTRVGVCPLCKLDIWKSVNNYLLHDIC